MAFSEALRIFKNIPRVRALNRARRACQAAGLARSEDEALAALLDTLRELTGKPIIVGV